MRRICVSCGVAGDQQLPLETEGDGRDAECGTCRKPLQVPSAFDCARLGLLDDLRELIAAVRGLQLTPSGLLPEC